MKGRIVHVAAFCFAFMGAKSALAQTAAESAPGSGMAAASSVPSPVPANAGVTEPVPSAQSSAEGTAPESATGPVKLEEVVVTATKRKERSQDVPLPISVISGAALKDAGVHDLKDLQYVDPSFKSVDTGADQNFGLRGVSTQTGAPEVEKSVGIVVDGVTDGDVTGLSDISRIEVLPGPQGTLFGKNATAGIVSVTTIRPNFNGFAADATVRSGQFFDHNVGGNVNIPLTDTFALRLSAFDIGQDGRGYSVPRHQRTEDTNNYGARAKVLWQATENLDVYLITAYAKHHDNRDPLNLVTASDPFNGPALTSYGITPNPKNRLSAETQPQDHLHQSASASLEVNYQFGDYTSTALVSYQRSKDFGISPIDPTGDQGPAANFLPVDNNGSINFYKTAELRLTSPKNSRIEFVGGLFGLNKKTGLGNGQNNGLEFAGTLGVPLPPGVFLALTDGVDYESAYFKSYAAFEQATIHLTDKLGLILGSRYTVDKVQGHFSHDASARHQFNYTAIPFGYTDPADPNPVVAGRNFSYRTGLQYKFTPDINVFASYATGYKGGGTSFIFGQNANFKPEKVRNIDIGLKSTLFNGSLQLNADLFDARFSNLQVQESCTTSTRPICMAIGNAGSLESKGGDLSVIWRATRQLTLNLSSVYTRAIFINYDINGDPTMQAAGYPLVFAPTWSIVGGAKYFQPLGDGFQFDAGINEVYRSSAYTTTKDTNTIIHGYGLLNGNIGFGPEDGRWRVGAYGRNLLNQFFYETVYVTEESAGPLNQGSNVGIQPTYSGHFSPEAFRTVGVTLDVKF